MAIEEYIRDIELAVNAKDMRKPIADAFRELDNQFEDLEIDEMPTANSNNLVESGGVYDLWNQVIDTNELILPTDEYISGEKVLTEQGTYQASDDHLDGYSTVIADQNIGKLSANLQSKYIYLDGEYNPENDNCDGYSLVVAELDANDFFQQTIERTLSGSIILSNILTIGAYGFYGCSLLETIDGTYCTKIDSHAFESCINLSEVSALKCETIGDNAFAYCSALQTINLNCIESFPNYAFYNCKKLQEIYIYDFSVSNLYNHTTDRMGYVSTIGDYAFYNCSTLYRFSGFSNWQIGYPQIDPDFGGIGNDIYLSLVVRKDIGQYAFYNCYNLSSPAGIVRLPEDDTQVFRIGQYAFCNCYNIRNSKYFRTQQNEAHYIVAFANSDSNTTVTTVEPGDRTLIIEKCAFKNCYNLHSICVQANKLHIHENAFENCLDMAIEYMDGMRVVLEPYACTNVNITMYDGRNGIVFESIGKYAFQSCGQCPTDIYGPSDSLCVIDEYAYDGCHCSRAALGNTEVMSMAFANCSQLSHVTFYSAIILHNSAFANCINLNEMKIDVDASNFSFEENAFDGTPFNDYNSASTTVVPKIGIKTMYWTSYYTDSKWSRYLSFFYSWSY